MRPMPTDAIRTEQPAATAWRGVWMLADQDSDRMTWAHVALTPGPDGATLWINGRVVALPAEVAETLLDPPPAPMVNRTCEYCAGAGCLICHETGTIADPAW